MRPKVRANALQARIAVAKRTPKTASRSRLPRGRAGCRARAGSPASEELQRRERRVGVEELEVVGEVVPGVAALRHRPPERLEPEDREREQEERDGRAAVGTKASSAALRLMRARLRPSRGRATTGAARAPRAVARARRRVRRGRARDRTPGAPRTRPRTPPPPTPRESRRRWLETGRFSSPKPSERSASRSRVSTASVPSASPRASSSSETTSGA